MSIVHSRITRRAALSASFGTLGLTSLAAQWLLADEPSARESDAAASDPKRPAKHVIMLFMAGGPSQVDTFDPKPDLEKLAGKDVPESLASRVPKIKRAGLRNLMASPWEFSQRGQSGIPVSSLFPHAGELADELCVIRSMTHRNPVHGPAECVALTGSGNGNRPSLGAWTLYGMGLATDNLPAFIAMNLNTNGMQYPQAAGWGPGFLPSRFQGTVVNPKVGIRYVAMPQGVTTERRRAELDAIRWLNQDFQQRVEGHSELEARLRSYETAFSMQTAGPELFDLAKESSATRKRYGLDEKATAPVARGCVLARRMVERGVRFVQLRVGGWDAHGNIKGNHESMAGKTDKPIAALLGDLKQRGLLESTLVVWCGEFGRTPTMEGRGRGRDHSPAAYSIWLAGGGVQGGRIVGATDAIGYTVEERPVTPHDLHATILESMGVDASQLTFNHLGLEESPLGVSGGAPVNEVFGVS